MSCVAVAAVTVARVAPKKTILLAAVVLKFVPVMVTDVPIGPLVGAKEVMVGISGTPNMKSVELRTVVQFVVTDILPVVAPTGTVVVILVAVLALTTAAVPLNSTLLFADTGLKLVPVMVTEVPVGPDDGEKEAMVGEEILPIVLRNTDTVVLPQFATARSALPSPSRSPMETE